MFKPKILCVSLSALALLACGAAETDAKASETAQEPTLQTVTADEPAASSVSQWAVIEEKSHIKFTAKQEGQAFTGEFPAFTADIRFDPANLEASSVKVEIPIGKADAGSKDRNNTLPEKVWFSVKKYPLAIFESSNFEKGDNNQFLAKGTLTMKGVSKPLSLPFTLNIEDTAVMKSELTINRTEWTIGEAPWDTDEWISRDITLDIQVTAREAR
jgi:polyisoprenoid-binding protein YceI